MLQGYKATIDWPAAPFYKQLMELYPDAKVRLHALVCAAAVSLYLDRSHTSKEFVAAGFVTTATCASL